MIEREKQVMEVGGFANQVLCFKSTAFKTPIRYSVTKSLSCLTLCDPMDCSLPGSSVHGILQARILEWVAMPSSKGSSQPRD